MNTTKSKSVLAIDIDDVLAENASAFIDYSNKTFGTNLTVDDYQEHWGEIWKSEYEETEKRALEYHQSGQLANYKVIVGAKEALEKLKVHFRLVLLTTRRNSVSQLTKDWIEKYYPNIFDDIVFTGFFDAPIKNKSIHMTKADLAKKIQADYLIDDQLKHVKAVAEIGIKGLLFGIYSWNKTDNLPEGVTRVKNWDEVIKYFEL
jgi:5'(3')-deoxyribonucleotidase